MANMSSLTLAFPHLEIVDMKTVILLDLIVKIAILGCQSNNTILKLCLWSTMNTRAHIKFIPKATHTSVNLSDNACLEICHMSR